MQLASKIVAYCSNYPREVDFRNPERVERIGAILMSIWKEGLNAA